MRTIAIYEKLHNFLITENNVGIYAITSSHKAEGCDYISNYITS